MSKSTRNSESERVFTVIIEEEAARLYATGNWISDIQVIDRIHQQSKNVVDARALQEFFHASREILPEIVESKYIKQTFDSCQVELRIKAGIIFKVKSTALDLGINGLGLILAIFSTTTWPFFFPVWLGLSVIVLVKSLYKGWESIRDPDERLIFEAIFRYQGRACVVNYDALENKNYNEAYGFVSPTVQNILLEIGHELTERETNKALASLGSRGIVEKRDGRWAISF